MATHLKISQLSDEYAGELLTLQRAAYVTEAQRYRDPDLPPLVETLPELIAELRSPAVTTLGAVDRQRLVGSVRLRAEGAVGHLGRLVVAPDRQGEGIGSRLLLACEEVAAAGVTEIRLFTGDRSEPTLRLYERHGYRRQRTEPAGTHCLVHLVKPLSGRGTPGPTGA